MKKLICSYSSSGKTLIILFFALRYIKYNFGNNVAIIVSSTVITIWQTEVKKFFNNKIFKISDHRQILFYHHTRPTDIKYIDFNSSISSRIIIFTNRSYTYLKIFNIYIIDEAHHFSEVITKVSQYTESIFYLSTEQFLPYISTNKLIIENENLINKFSDFNYWLDEQDKCNITETIKDAFIKYNHILLLHHDKKFLKIFIATCSIPNIFKFFKKQMKLYKEFCTAPKSILCTTYKNIIEGSNLNNCDAIILIYPTLSSILVKKCINKIYRQSNINNNIYVYIIVNNFNHWINCHIACITFTDNYKSKSEAKLICILTFLKNKNYNYHNFNDYEILLIFAAILEKNLENYNKIYNSKITNVEFNDLLFFLTLW